jgi:hypothetical protein
MKAILSLVGFSSLAALEILSTMAFRPVSQVGSVDLTMCDNILNL